MISLTKFIQQNRAEISDKILIMIPNITSINDKERGLWIRDHPYINAWARDMGVKVAPSPPKKEFEKKYGLKLEFEKY
jgi:hypothetical protein